MVEQGLGDWRSTMVEQISLAINTAMAETSQRLEACIARFCEQEELLMNTLKDDQLRYQQEVRSSLSSIMAHDTTTEISAQQVFDVIPDRNSVFSDEFLHYGSDNGFGSDEFLSDEIKFVNVVEKPVFASFDNENSGVEESVVSKPFVTNPNEKISEDVGKLDKGDKGTVMETDFTESKDVGLGNSGIKEVQWCVFSTDVLQNGVNDSESFGELGDDGKIEESLACDNSNDNKVSTMPSRLMFDDSSGRDERPSKANRNRNGPIKRVENEYGPQGKNLGAAGHNYMTWAAKLIVGLDTGVPWVMCKEEDAPDVVKNTCNGFYCDNFSPNRPYKPTIWTEALGGWFTEFGGPIHNRPVQDLAFAVARFIKKGGSFVNYYKYHGGTNLGCSAGGSFITTSYHYEAPLDEYNLIRHPKYGQLKELHRAIKLCEHALVSADPIVTSLGSSQQAHVFSSENGNCAIFLANYDTKSAARVMFSNMHYKLPLWSISNLSDCRNAVFNFLDHKHEENFFEDICYQTSDRTGCSALSPMDDRIMSYASRTDDDSSRLHVFCLQHAAKVEQQLCSIGGAHMLLLCHPAYPKLQAEAKVMADELGSDHLWSDITFREATKDDKEKLKSALDSEESIHGNGDWAVNLGINIYYSANLSRSPLYSQQVSYNSVIYSAFGCGSSDDGSAEREVSGKWSGKQKNIVVAGKWCDKVWISNQVHPLLAARDDKPEQEIGFLVLPAREHPKSSSAKLEKPSKIHEIELASASSKVGKKRKSNTEIKTASRAKSLKVEEPARAPDDALDNKCVRQYKRNFRNKRKKELKKLQERKHICGMTGGGVNDATNAAWGASDIVLTQPGLDVIIHVVLTSRDIFQMMKNYAIYAVSITIRLVLGFMFIALIWKFDFSPFMVVIIAILNGGTIMTISKDRMKPSPLPDSWKRKEIFATSIVLRGYKALLTVIFFWLMKGLTTFDATWEGIEQLLVHFLTIDLEDKVVLWERGNVMDWPQVIWAIHL